MNALLNTLGLLFLLVSLEIVLGIDNVLIITLLVGPLAPTLRQRARVIGLLLALLLRLGFVMGAFWLSRLTEPLISHFSARDLLLLLGGIFLVFKAAEELASMVFFRRKKESPLFTQRKTAGAVIAQIVALDVLFSIDSVITAVGLTSHLGIIFIAVVFSFALLLCYVGRVGEFILSYPSLKIVALAFLLLIGLSFISDSCGFVVDKSLIYSAGAFAALVELLQTAYRR